MIIKKQLLNTRNLLLPVFSLLFFILLAPWAQAGSCMSLGPSCIKGCVNALEEATCNNQPGGSAKWSWSPSQTCAQNTLPQCPPESTSENSGAVSTEALPNPLGTTDIPTLIGNVIKALLGVTGSIALLMFIYGGILWLISAGNEKRVEQGKSVLTWATIGLGIIFTSYILVNFVIKSLTGS